MDDRSGEAAAAAAATMMMLVTPHPDILNN
jgi:hypothetical protein